MRSRIYRKFAYILGALGFAGFGAAAEAAAPVNIDLGNSPLLTRVQQLVRMAAQPEIAQRLAAAVQGSAGGQLTAANVQQAVAAALAQVGGVRGPEVAAALNSLGVSPNVAALAIQAASGFVGNSPTDMLAELIVLNPAGAQGIMAAATEVMGQDVANEAMSRAQEIIDDGGNFAGSGAAGGDGFIGNQGGAGQLNIGPYGG